MELITQFTKVSEGNSYSADAILKVTRLRETLQEDLTLLTTGGFFKSNNSSSRFASFTLKVMSNDELRASTSLVKKIALLEDLKGQLTAASVVTDAMKALATKFIKT